MGPTPRWARAGLLAGPLALWTALYVALRIMVDTRGFPGPGGVKLVAAIAEGFPAREPTSQVVAWVQPWLGGDLWLAVAVVLGMSGALVVLGSMLAAGALGQGRTAPAAGFLAATLGPVWFASLMFAGDLPAMGLAMLGVGIAWRSASMGWPALLGLPVGMGLCLAGAATKFTVLPVTAVCGLGVLLVQHPKLGVRATLALAGGLVSAGVLFSLRAGLTGGVERAGRAPQRQPPEALAERLWDLLTGTADGQLMLLCLGLAALGALLPGPRRWARPALFLGVLAALAGAVWAIDAKLKIRHLGPIQICLLPLVAFVWSWVQDRSQRLAWLPRAWPWPAGTLVLGLLCWDGLGLVGHWAVQRTALEGAHPAPFVDWVPGRIAAYATTRVPLFEDTTISGGLAAFHAGQAAPAQGIAGVRLHDGREFHLRAGASLQGTPSRVLDHGKCCQGAAPDVCAPTLVAALDAAGAQLLLPDPSSELHAGNAYKRPWAAQLLAAAQSVHGSPSATDPWWLRFDGRGSGGPLPCVAPKPGQ